MTDLPIEFARSDQPRVIRHVPMDRDGTASLTRGGWTNIMAALDAEHLPPLAVKDGVVADFHRARQIVEPLIAS